MRGLLSRLSFTVPALSSEVSRCSLFPLTDDNPIVKERDQNPLAVLLAELYA